MSVGTAFYPFVFLRHVHFLGAGGRKQPGILPIGAAHHFSFCTYENGAVSSISHDFIGSEFFRTLGLYPAVHPVKGNVLPVFPFVLEMYRRRDRAAVGIIGLLEDPIVNGAYAAVDFRWIAQVQHFEYGSDNRSEEHTSELQSRENLVCRLLLEK